MSDSDASTVDPEDLKCTKTAVPDSDASTIDPNDFEDTEVYDPSELQHLRDSPDLFSDYPTTGITQNKNKKLPQVAKSKTSFSQKKEAKLFEKKQKKRVAVKENNLLKPTVTKTEKLVKRRSKVHEISDSESETDECKSRSELTAKMSGEQKAKAKDNKNDNMKIIAHKKDYSQPFDNSLSGSKTYDKEKIEKQKFISDFLNMSENEQDESSQKKINRNKKEVKSIDKNDVHKNEKNTKQTTCKSNPEIVVALNKTDKTKVKQNDKGTHTEQNDTSLSTTRSLKRKSSSSSPQVFKRSDTEIVKTDTNTNSNESEKPRCKYGAKCYRKNPSHRQEFSHPDNGSPSTGRDSPPAKKVKLRESPPPKSRSPSPRTKSPPRTPKTVIDKVSQAQPYSFFLTRVHGITEKYNSSFVMDIKDILSPEMGNLTASCQFNYMFDVEWLMKQYPPQFRSKPLLLVHGEQGPSKAELQAQAINYKNIRFCQAKLEMMFGTHHTKMMLLLYDNGLRVVIHTSNLIQQDWFQKTQGMWISPVFPKLPSPNKDKGDSPTHFKTDLIDYLTAYKAYQLQEWIENLASHNMSEARVIIIASVPGRHTTDKNKWGHLKLRKTLGEHGPSYAMVKTWPVIGQFSSIGSMGANKDQWLCGEWLESLSSAKSVVGVPSKARLQLVFPTKDNVRLSLEGFPAGGSIPYSVNTAKKQTWLHDFFHVWQAEVRGRSKAMPHIKTFLRPTQDGKKVSWFLVTSANLSKAAWGAFEKKGAQLMIRSYEIGVLFLPKFFGKDEIFTIADGIADARSSDHILLPYDLPPTPYKKGDRPWMWDIPYMDLPDTNGNMWCPFSK